MKYIALGLVLFFAMAGQAYADQVSAREVEVIANSLKYVRGIDSKSKTLHVIAVYDPSVAGAEVEAKSFVDQFTNASKSDVKVSLVRFAELGGQNDADIAFIAGGLKSQLAPVFDYAKKHHVFTITRDMECVKNKACVVGVRAETSVDVYLSEETMRALGFEVDSAFKFMVKRI